MADIRVERNYYTDDGVRRAALIIDGTVRATLTGTECFDLASELETAGDRLHSADGGTGDDDECGRCPQCGSRNVEERPGGTCHCLDCDTLYKRGGTGTTIYGPAHDPDGDDDDADS